MRYFMAVAEELHFGRAALKLHMAQPPLSQQIRQLEVWIGHPLFERTSRSVRLTAAGIELRKRLELTLEKLKNDVLSTRLVARGQRGALDVAFIESSILTILPEMLGRYRAEYPDVNVRLQAFHTRTLIQALQDGRADVGFLRDADVSEGLSVERVLTEEFVAIVPGTHPAAHERSINVSRLRGDGFVLFSPEIGQNAWQKTIGICEEQGFQPRIVQEAPQWLTILRLVGAGLGVTIAPRCVSTIAAGGVAILDLKGTSARSYIEMAFRTCCPCPILDGFMRLARVSFLESAA